MLPDELSTALARLSKQYRRRTRQRLDSPQGPKVTIASREFLNFASNDYLGLAAHPELIAAATFGLKQWGVGSGASPLLSGHMAVHEAAEQALAQWTQFPAALLFSSGYSANLAVLTSLLDRHSAVFADRLNHASLNDGCMLSRARFFRFQHNDLTHLETLLNRSSAHTKLIAVDAVYSMDGDEAPLTQLLSLARQYQAWLFLDDAHGFGVMGEGRGSAALYALNDDRIIYMATLGKAAGVSGAFVAASTTVIEWLINRARPYLFSTAPTPALACAILASLKLIANEPWRRTQLFNHIQRLNDWLCDQGLATHARYTPIRPLYIGTDQKTLSLAKDLNALGLWVAAIRPPTVPQGSARLRISLSAAHSAADLEELIAALEKTLLQGSSKNLSDALAKH